MEQPANSATAISGDHDWGCFASGLAEVLFDEHPGRELSELERQAVERFEAIIERVSETRLTALALRIDKLLVARLSGAAMLRVARRIEERAPEVITLMPRLSAHQRHLVRSADVADAFSFAALERLVVAIREESKRT